MTKKTVSILSIITLLLAATLPAWAQNSTSSPYSLYGVGTLTPKEDATSAGMGHTGVGLAPNNWVNLANPAALNKLDSTTFYFNLQLKGFYARERTSKQSQSVYSANIDGITMAFRVTKWWAAALGYAPYSTVGYNMSDQNYIIGAETKYNIRHTGSGGLQQAFINNSITFFRHLSVGVSTSALWGSITKTETAEFGAALGGETIYNTKKYTMNNMFFEYGLQYDFNIGKNNFRLGAVYNDKTHLYSSYDHIVSNDVSSELFFDDTTPLKDDFYVPKSYAAGISFTRNKLVVAADAKYSEWSAVRNVKFRETAKYQDNWSIGGGFQYSAGEYNDPFYKRIRYRLGYYYTTDYLKLRGAKLDSYSITAGLTIPMGRWNNAIVVAYEYQHRGSVFNGMVEENVHNVKLALNIRETWFVKTKFE